MIYTVNNILIEELKSTIPNLLKELQWYDGKKTSGKLAAKGKYNLQCDASNGSNIFLQFQNKIHSIISNNEKISKNFSIGLPIMIHSIRLNKYDEGMKYDWHVDNPFGLRFGKLVTCNYGFVIMMDDNFEGGELELELPNFIDEKKHIKKWKGKVGDMIIFPSFYKHRVKKITSGSRVVVNGWIAHPIQKDNDLKLLINLNNIENYVNKNIEDEDKKIKIITDLTQIKAELVNKFKTIT